MADLCITVTGRDNDAESLQDWLRNEPQLRGHLRQGGTSARPGTMGSPTELIVGVISSGAVTVLARSLQVWLTQRRADVKLNVAGPQGRHIVLDAKRVPDAEDLLNTALGWVEDAPAQASEAGQGRQ